MNDRGFFDPSRWLRKQEERDYVFKKKKIKKPNVYPMVARWAKRHFPKAIYRQFYARIPSEISKYYNLIANRIYSVDEIGRKLIEQLRCYLEEDSGVLASLNSLTVLETAMDNQCAMPEYVKVIEEWTPFGDKVLAFRFLLPIQTDNSTGALSDYHSDELEAFLKNATLSQYVKYIDKVSNQKLRADSLVSLVEDFM